MEHLSQERPSGEGLKEKLEQAWGQGSRWLSFVEYPDQSTSFTFHAHLRQAHAAFMGDLAHDTRAGIVDIPGALQDLRQKISGPLTQPDQQEVQRAFGAFPQASFAHPDTLKNLAEGKATLVSWRQPITPGAFDHFVVVQHVPPTGTIYEQGHSNNISKPMSYLDALDLVQRQTHAAAQRGVLTDSLLTGVLRGKELRIDYEGMPLDHTGVVVKHGYTALDDQSNTHRAQLSTYHAIDKPMLVDTKMLARYDGQHQRLEFLNGALKPINPDMEWHNVQIRFFTPAKLDLNMYSFTQPKETPMQQQKAMEHLEGKFKEIGAKEAFTPGLVEALQKGAATYQHRHKDTIDGNKTETTFHLKKSPSSEYYFLNKFDMTVERPDKVGTLKQTFYLDNTKKQEGQVDKPMNFTYKKAYNLVAGRPVFDTNTEEWKKLKPYAKLENGNHEVQTFSKAYGFDLKHALNQYAITDKHTPKYADSLMDSLKRGNLQSATFVDATGKKEKLYVSPNIKLGMLNVYDDKKKAVSLDAQVDKGYITANFAAKIKEVMKNTPTQNKSQSVNKAESNGPQQMKENLQRPAQRLSK